MLNNVINVDLHIHSKASEYKENEGYVEESNINNVEVLLNKLEENKINLMAISDHNRFDFNLYEKIKKTIEINNYNSLCKNLPAIEFDVELEENTSKVCHIVCIFDDEDNDKILKISENMGSIRVLNSKEEYYTLQEFESILKKINLSVLLIAHQKTGLDKSDGKHKSLSEAVSDPNVWLGYINALEYKKVKVQGMIKNNLKEIRKKFATITGSDCHVWSAYPNKDNTSIDTTEYISKLKCMPSFKGLVFALTSPDTRFDRKEEGCLANYIKEITINDEIIPLSTGINAIIGDNASGKSFLLTNLNNKKLPPHYKTMKNKNKINLTIVGNPKIEMIEQGSIIENVRKGELLNNKDNYHNISNISLFKAEIKRYVESLKKYIKNSIDENIRKSTFEEKTIEIKESLEYNNFYPSLKFDIKPLDNLHEERKVNLQNILDLLKLELENNNDYYKKIDENKIKHAIQDIVELIKVIEIQDNKIKLQNKVINIVISCFNTITDEIDADRSSKELELEEYKKDLESFSNLIVDYIKKPINTEKFPTDIKKISGQSVKNHNGINFIKKAKFHNLEGLEEDLFKYLFNQKYQSKTELKNIKTIREFSESIKGITDATKIQDIYQQMDKNKDKFLNEYLKEETTIQEENGTQDLGTTPGEIALTFYKMQLNNHKDIDILLIDQPEDDISMKKIENYLINSFNKMRDKKQVIFVTHNPLLVVNLDVDNVIYVNKEKTGQMNVYNGCLEYHTDEKSIIDIVRDNLDGGYDVIERRLKIYGG